MPVRIVVREDEPLDAALARLRSVMYRLRTRPWHHRRYGYFEKPSALRQKKKKMHTTCRGAVLRVDLDSMLARTGPTNRAGS